MMSYDSKEGSFHLNSIELECINTLCSERITDMETDLNSKDPHMYVLLKSTTAKLNGFINLIEAKKKSEVRKNMSDV